MEDAIHNGEAEQREQDVPPVAGVDGLAASAAAPSTDATDEGALSVTRHVPFTSPVEWKVLACGIDSLDIGLQVRWGKLWDEFSARLEEGKNLAVGTNGLPSRDGRFLILPSGKPPNYRWHLQFPGFHLYIGRSPEPHEKTPNVYASINSQTLWQSSIGEAVALVQREIESFGGVVVQLKPSRCDLAADFLIPNGLSYDFLNYLRVPCHFKQSCNSTGDRLETFYYGAKSSPIQLRIYDKALEVQKKGTKFWFLDVWQLAECKGVWRVEFQLRRSLLKSFSINTVPELISGLNGLWTHLTHDWFSLRLLDDTNTTRRTVHPWWQDVQSCADRFGTFRPLIRNTERQTASVDWYVAHIAGCFVGLAARLQVNDCNTAIQALAAELRRYFAVHSFRGKYTVQSIKLGHPGIPRRTVCRAVSPPDPDEDAT